MRVYHTVEKTDWPAGDWHNEPDKIQWTDGLTGLPCLVKRHPEIGFLCGYVGVPKTHPDHSVEYNAGPEDRYDVHGGLTYSAGCGHGDEATSICHVPEPGEPDDVWWFGFDCGHLGDLSPSPRSWKSVSDSYRNVEYVREQCRHLAVQLKKAAE